MKREAGCLCFCVSLLLLLPCTVFSLPGLKHYETLSYDPVEQPNLRQARSLKDSKIHLHFHAFNRSFEVELSPSLRVFAPKARFVAGDGTNIPYDPRTFYDGRVIGESRSTVSGHIINGVFDGVINTAQGEYHIEQAHKFFNNDQNFHSVIYRAGDVEHKPASCGAKEEILRQMKKLQSTAVPMREEKAIYGSHLLRRKRLTLNSGTFCQMLVAADHLFVQNVGSGNDASAVSEIVTVMSQVQSIFRDTDFDNDGTIDNIIPSIAQVEILNQNAPGYRFGASNIEVNNFLDLWSQEDHSQFCLALLLTYRDFANGVLGLAWVAEPPGGNRGGVCEGEVRLATGQRYLNTAIVTFLNFGQRQPRSVSIVTVAHEIGHNFGSPHDPTSGTCAPGGGTGNFIMFPQATDGRRDNNKLFSPCSRVSMSAVLRTTRSNCFTMDGTFCGNGALEDGEACDCGEECDTDNCCTSECELRPNANCTGQQECCIGGSCAFKPPTSVCREETECGFAVMCTGDSAICGAPMPRAENGLCNNGSNVCEDGVCSGSFCLSQGLVECDCTNVETEGCHVCCRPSSGGTCMSTLTQFPNNGQFREPGRTCNNFQGYCDASMPPRCIIVDNENTLNDLLDIFTINTLSDIVAWLTVYWYIPVAVVIGIAILMICLHFTYRRRKPIKQRFNRARNSLRGRPPPPRDVSEAQTGGVGGANSADGGGRQRRRGPRQITQREAENRLKQFFPTADRDTIAGVMQVSQSESKAVKRLLDLGFPLRKVPIPRA